MTASAPGFTPLAGVSTGTIGALRAGYGFIERPGEQPALFFFWADVESNGFGSLHEGMRVRFVHGSNNRGLCARHITPLEIAAQRS